MTMPEPATDSGRAALRHVVSDPASALLVTDYDGTLAPIVLDPAQAYPAPGAVEVLSALAGQLRTVAVLTRWRGRLSGARGCSRAGGRCASCLGWAAWAWGGGFGCGAGTASSGGGAVRW